MIVSSEFSSLNLPISMPSHPRREIPRLRPEPSLREGGNRAVVTAPLATPSLSSQSHAGVAWVFDFENSQWSAGTPVWSSVAQATERLGESVAILPSGD